jgi:hypothetical protein
VYAQISLLPPHVQNFPHSSSYLRPFYCFLGYLHHCSLPMEPSKSILELCDSWATNLFPLLDSITLLRIWTTGSRKLQSILCQKWVVNRLHLVLERTIKHPTAEPLELVKRFPNALILKITVEHIPSNFHTRPLVIQLKHLPRHLTTLKVRMPGSEVAVLSDEFGQCYTPNGRRPHPQDYLPLKELLPSLESLDLNSGNILGDYIWEILPHGFNSLSLGSNTRLTVSGTKERHLL